MVVRFANVDEPTDFIDVPSFGYGVDPQDKGPGKAMSYAVKYALLKALGLETGDDADHDNVNHTRDDPHVPTLDFNAMAQRLIGLAQKAKTPADLDAIWKGEADVRRTLSEAEMLGPVADAFGARKRAMLGEAA